jgi:hypothetical protein
MPGGPENPIGARALYLWQGNKDTLYRIHGTNEPWTIGQNVSSGCIRLTNDDVVDLYNRTPVGTKVVVLAPVINNNAAKPIGYRNERPILNTNARAPLGLLPYCAFWIIR